MLRMRPFAHSISPKSSAFTPPVLILVFMLMTPKYTSSFGLLLHAPNPDFQLPVQQLYLDILPAHKSQNILNKCLTNFVTESSGKYW